jgi:hypothetical protein
MFLLDQSETNIPTVSSKETRQYFQVRHEQQQNKKVHVMP